MNPERFFAKENVKRSAVIMLAFNVADNLMLLVRGVIFARWLGPAEYGVFTLAFFFLPATVALAKLGVPSSFARYIPRYEMQGSLREFLRRTNYLVLGGSVLVTAACLIWAKEFSRWIYGHEIYGGIVVICALSILPGVIRESLSATFGGLRVFVMDAGLRIGQSFMLAAGGIAVAMLTRRAGDILWVNLISIILSSIVFGFVLRRYLESHGAQSRPIQEPDFYPRIMRFSLPYVLGPVILLIYSYSDRWILSRLMDLTSVGIYSVASRTAGIIYTFGLVAGTVMVPNLSKYWEQGNRPRVNQLINLSVKANLIMLLTGAVLILVTKDTLVPLLYGTEYVRGLPLFGILLIYWLMQCINATIGGYATLVEKTYIPLVVIILGLAGAVALNFLLIPKLGLAGAALASMASTAAMCLGLYLWLTREGLSLTASTLLLCLTPGILIFPPWICGLLYLVLIFVGWKTSWLIKPEERTLLAAQFRSILDRLLRRRGAETPDPVQEG